MQPLSVQAPESQFMGSRGLIPPSQGLLATADTSPTIHTAPVSLPSNDSIQRDPAPQVLGLKLLQLRPPLPQQSAPHHPQAQGSQALHTANPTIIETHQHKFKNTDQSASVPKRQLNFNPPHDPRSSQARSQTSERSRGQIFSLLPSALPAHTPAPMQGLRLLHFDAAPHSNTTFPKLPLPSSSRPPTFISAAPMIKLLRIEPGPKMASNASIISRFKTLGIIKSCIVVYVQIFVSATDVSRGSSFTSNDPSHVHGGVGKFSDGEAERWRGSTAAAQSGPTYWQHKKSYHFSQL